MLKTNKDVNILVSSCDEYSDLWSPFFALFERYWSDCPYPIYLSTVSTPFSSSIVHQVLVGSRIGWGDGLIKALSIIQQSSPSKYTILLLDDYLLNKRVDSARIQACIHALEALDGHYLRLVPKPAPDIPVPQYTFLGKISKNSPYRLSLQASLWKTETLISLLRPTDTPWDMELIGSERSKQYDGFYCTNRSIVSYLNGVDRGRWVPESREFLTNQGIIVNTSIRPIYTDDEFFLDSKSHFKKILRKILPLQQRLFLRTLYAKVFKRHID